MTSSSPAAHVPDAEPAPPSAMGAQLTPWQRLSWPFVRWYAHRELPRYGYLLDWWGMNRQPDWARAHTVESRERFHGYRVKLDLADFFQRINYFFGAYHEFDVLSTLDLCLRPGEAFLDGGANIGLVTLHSAGIVGPGGRVDAFEPNPEVFARLAWHVQVNDLKQVRVHQLGLGEAAAQLHVRMPGLDNQAAATLGVIPQRYGDHVRDLGTVRVVPGDEVLGDSDVRPLVIKLDVEGFELLALRGLRRTLEHRRPALVLEANGEMLEMNGGSPAALHDFLEPLGYRAWALDRGGFRQRHRLKLHPLRREHLAWEKDVLFLSPDGPHWKRAEPHFQPPGRYWRHLELAAAGHQV